MVGAGVGCEYMLKPLNPRYPTTPMPPDACIVGIVVEVHIEGVRVDIVPRSEREPLANSSRPGVAMPSSIIRDLFRRLDEATEIALKIDARETKAGRGLNYRSPVRRLAGKIKGIYNTLDVAYGHAICLDDVLDPSSTG